MINSNDLRKQYLLKNSRTEHRMCECEESCYDDSTIEDRLRLRRDNIRVHTRLLKKKNLL